MAEADDRARKLRELDALHDYYGMKYKIDLEKNEEESRNLGTCMPLHKRVLTLREQGNWAQAQKWRLTGETIYRQLETVEGFPVDMALMRSLRASLDEFRGYEIVHMPARFSQGRGPLSVYPEHGEHGQLDQEDELENKRLDNERKEYQDRSLANMRAATASDEKSAQTARPDSSAHQSKRAEVDEQTPVEGSAKVSTKTPKEPTAAAAASRPVQDGDDPLENARNGKLLLQCLSCGETFAELIDVDSHVPHKDMPLVVIRLIAVHSGQLFQCGPPFTLASDKSKTEALVRASQAPEAAPRTQEAAMSARRVEEISEQMNRLCQETGRLAVELVQHLYKIQAAHEQRQQEAMQQEMEALNVQEASIAAQKRELRAKMRK